jgi:hypothetical protein
VSGQPQALALLITATKELQYALNRRLEGTQSQSGGFGGEKILLPLPRIECQLLGCPTCIAVTILMLCLNSLFATEYGCAQCSVSSVY